MQASLFETPVLTPTIAMPDIIPAPKHPTAKQVIDKILNVKKSNLSRISSIDLQEMNSLQAYFTEQMNKLDRWDMLFKFEMEAQYSGRWKIDPEKNGYCYVNISKAETDNPFSDREFTPDDAIESIYKNRYRLRSGFFVAIISHFKEEYGLQIDDDDTDLVESLQHYEPVIDYIFSQLPTANLKEYALQAMTNGFIEMKFGKRGMTNDKHKILFDNAGFYRFENSNKAFKTLFSCLGYFETGEAGNMLLGKEIQLGNYSKSQSYDLKGEKVKSIRMYQNGKAIIYFKDEITANEFYNLF